MIPKSAFVLKAQYSNLTGEELRQRLDRVGWTPSMFARFIGVTGPTVYRYVGGSLDGKLPLSVQRNLEYVESDPIRLRALPGLQTPGAARRRASQAASEEFRTQAHV